MFRAVLYGVAVCGIYGVGLVRRSGEVKPTKSYELSSKQGDGIISEILVRDDLVEVAERVENEEIIIENTGSINPETLLALKVPLQALIDGAVSVDGKKFRSCSDVEALELTDFDINYVVVNTTGSVVGYFEDSPKASTAG